MNLSKIESFLLQKFEKACKVNRPVSPDPPVWKSIFFILDLIGQGDFYGRIEITVSGCNTKSPVVVRRTFKVDAMYLDIEDSLTLDPKDKDSVPQVLHSKDMVMK